VDDESIQSELDQAEAKYDRDSRTWGMVCHLAGLAGCTGIPLGSIIGPLVIWLIKKEEFPYVDEQGKKALNFQISWTIWGIVAGVTILIVIGIVLLPLVLIAWLVLTIIGTIKASNGEPWDYPLTIEFLK
jgi:uncharacterized Tic20 family protein